MNSHSHETTALTPQDVELPWPTGFAGELAHFIYHNSYMPVKEVAITATLALLAGVCGRAYLTHTSKDLALYIILVARSGIGKDGIHEGIPKLIQLAGVPGAERFIRSANFVSGPALHKAILTQPGFLNLQGEFGRKLKGMGDIRNGPMQELRTVMTDAYGKTLLEGRSYSNSEKSLQAVHRPALSFLGETTPDTFLGALTSDMMEDGFMSRFLIVSYDGQRPEPNDEFNICSGMEAAELDHWQSLLRHTIPYQQTINTPSPIRVDFANHDAYDKLKTFELTCTQFINQTSDEYERQMWNRAHLKALKIAGLLAVADDFLAPKIHLRQATWALTIVRSDIAVFQIRKRNGDIGNDDHARESKLLAMISDYLKNGAPESYKIPDTLLKRRIVPRLYLQKRVSSDRTFKGHRLGTSSALDLTLRSLVDSGYLIEADKHSIMEQCKFNGKCYLALRL